MLQLGFNLQLRQTHKLWSQLSHEQRLQYRLMLRQEPLKDIHIGIKGLKGIRKAHQILYDHGATGMLIGGLSEEIWNARAKPSDLAKHKDVDVMVLTMNSGIERFEGRVDWWLPQGPKTIRYFLGDAAERTDSNTIWWENANNVVLDFEIKGFQNILETGLYLPSRELVATMRGHEKAYKVDSSPGMDFIDLLIRRIQKTMGKALPGFIKKEYEEYILQIDSEFQVQGFPNSKINKIEKGEFEPDTLQL